MMNQYLVTAYDYTDPDAFQRRLNVRQHHLDGARDLKASGNYLLGGAILNGKGKMIGTVMILQFEMESELQTWQQNEVYITQKIWETYDIKPFRVAGV